MKNTDQYKKVLRELAELIHREELGLAAIEGRINGEYCEPEDIPKRAPALMRHTSQRIEHLAPELTKKVNELKKLKA